jgi:hypothetical protein
VKDKALKLKILKKTLENIPDDLDIWKEAISLES